MSEWSPDFNNDDDFHSEDEETMFFSSEKDAIIFAIDCSSSMFEKQGDDIPIQAAVRCNAALLEQKITSSPNDLVGTLFYNTSVSNNAMEFKNINSYFELDLPSAERIVKLRNLAQDLSQLSTELGNANEEVRLGDVFWTCSNLFSVAGRGKIGTKRVFLITNEDRPHEKEPQLCEVAKTKLQDLLDLGVTVELFSLNKAQRPFDYKLFYQDALKLSSDMETISGSEKLEELQSQVLRKEPNKRTSFRVPFFIGEGLTIGVEGYSFILEQKKGAYQYVEERTNRPVKTSTSWICADTGQQLLGADFKYCYPYGGENAIFTMDEIVTMKTLIEPGLYLLGFRSREKLKFHHNIKHPFFLYPDESRFVGSKNTFACFLQALLDMNKVAYCILLTRKNSSISLVALLPQEELRDDAGQIKPSGFHVIHLPFADDLRKVPKPDNMEKANSEQCEAMKNIIGKLVFQGGFDPDNYHNPYLQKHYKNLQSLALETYSEDDFHDSTIPDVEKTVGRVEDAVVHLKKLFEDEGLYLGPKSSFTTTAKKRSTDRDPESASAAKKNKSNTNVDLKGLYQEGRLDRLTVPQLKEALLSHGVQPKGRKADLLQQLNQVYSESQ